MSSQQVINIDHHLGDTSAGLVVGFACRGATEEGVGGGHACRIALEVGSRFGAAGSSLRGGRLEAGRRAR
jgi:hypothetical protein